MMTVLKLLLVRMRSVLTHALVLSTPTVLFEVTGLDVNASHRTLEILTTQAAILVGIMCILFKTAPFQNNNYFYFQ